MTISCPLEDPDKEKIDARETFLEIIKAKCTGNTEAVISQNIQGSLLLSIRNHI